MKKIFPFVFIAYLLILSSCSMQKRLYTKGFYAHKNQNVKKQDAIAKKDTLPSIATNNIKTKVKTKELVATNTRFIIPAPKLTDGCDTIVLKNGAKVLAMINEINLTKILFRNCNSIDETIIFIRKSDVSYINFANGSKQVFDTENNYNQPQNLPGDRHINQNTPPTKRHKRSNNYDQSNSGKLNPFSLISFIISVVPYPFIIILFALFGLVSLVPGNSNVFGQIFGTPHMSAPLFIPFVFVIAAIIMSIVAIYQIKNSGGDQKGLKLAYVALVLSLILLLLLLLFAF